MTLSSLIALLKRPRSETANFLLAGPLYCPHQSVRHKINENKTIADIIVTIVGEIMTVGGLRRTLEPIP
ncbi:hypothetical protein C2W62_42140 [Candidatus Entotheonella serta]|nr:hypothetical protein C2W62_42140 [Candidatus Entotheonella serta]